MPYENGTQIFFLTGVRAGASDALSTFKDAVLWNFGTKNYGKGGVKRVYHWDGSQLRTLTAHNKDVHGVAGSYNAMKLIKDHLSKSNPRKRRNGQRYDYPEYIEFLYDIDYSQVPQKEKKAFEKEVDRVLQNSGLDDYVTDYDEIYYLTLASLAGHGVGLWEGREQWHLDLEKAIKYDLKATSKLRDAFFRLDENATIASLDG